MLRLARSRLRGRLIIGPIHIPYGALCPRDGRSLNAQLFSLRRDLSLQPFPSLGGLFKSSFEALRSPFKFLEEAMRFLAALLLGLTNKSLRSQIRLLFKR